MLRGRVLWVVLGCFVCQLGLGYAYLFSPLLQEVTSDLGWTRTQFAAARAIYFPVLALGAALAGQLTVRIGARPVLFASALCLGATFWAFSRMQQPSDLYLANVLYGMFMAGLGDVVVGGVVIGWVERGRGLALGFAYAASNVGGMAVAPIFAVLTEAVGWRDALQILAVAGVLLILPFTVLAGRRPPPRSRAREAEHSAAALSLREALGTRSFWVLAVALAVYFAYFVGVNDAFFAVMMDAGRSRGEAAMLYSAAVGAGGLSKVAVGVLADRISSHRLLIVDYALLAASAFCLLFLPSNLALGLFLASYGLAVAARDVVYPLIVSFCFGERSMPQVYGALMLVLAVAGGLGSILTQSVYDATGTYRMAFVAYAVLNSLVLLSLALVRRETK
jgi:MFS family permease